MGSDLLRRKRRVWERLSTSLLGGPPDILRVGQIRTRRRKLGHLKFSLRWYDLMGRVSKKKLKNDRSHANEAGPSRSHFSVIFILHVLKLCTVANSGGPRKRKKSGTSPKRLSKEDRQAQQRKVAASLLCVQHTAFACILFNLCACPCNLQKGCCSLSSVFVD